MQPRQYLVAGLSLLWVATLSVVTLPDASSAKEGLVSVDRLIEVLENASEPEVRWRAAERLGAIEGPPERIVPALTQALGWDVHPTVRGRAAEALGIIGPVTKEVVPALIEALGWDDQLRVRWRVVEALEAIGPATDEVVPTLIKVLATDEYPGVRARAAQALGAIGPVTETVVPALTETLRDDSHAGVRRQAAGALERNAVILQAAKATESVGPLKEAFAALTAHNEPDIRINAAAVRHAIEFLERELEPQGPIIIKTGSDAIPE
jgi:HEAT repeat protein